jgi:hypothetical protein
MRRSKSWPTTIDSPAFYFAFRHLDHSNVFCPKPFRPIDDIELDLLTFRDGLHRPIGERRTVKENIFLGVGLRLYESESPGGLAYNFPGHNRSVFLLWLRSAQRF